jgi:hypothetical protein
MGKNKNNNILTKKIKILLALKRLKEQTDAVLLVSIKEMA